MRHLALVSLLLCSACLPATVSTPAHVTRIRTTPSGRALFGCVVAFGWTWDELVGACGEPDEIVAHVGDASGKCAIYVTEGTPFAVNVSEPRVAACVCEVTRGRAKRGNESTSLRVTTVYGLRAP